jgi:uncharacterized RDD family membrane protein YckC
MDIWIIQDGEKKGPHPPFHIREGISSGRYDAETPAWHEGLDDWTTLGGMGMFRDEFDPAADFAGGHPGDGWLERGAADRNADDRDDAPRPFRTTVAMEPSGRLYLARRFWARWVDLHLYMAVWWLFLWITHRDIGAIFNTPWIMLIQLLPWFAVEAALLHLHGTTPGKWLLGIRVINEDGGPLSLGQAVKRSLRVYVAGIGMGWGPLAPICQGISWWITRRIGRTLWDHLGNHRVEVSAIRPVRYFATAVVLIVSMHLQFAVIAPHFIRASPYFQEMFGDNPPPHFQERAGRQGI